MSDDSDSSNDEGTAVFMMGDANKFPMKQKAQSSVVAKSLFDIVSGDNDAQNVAEYQDEIFDNIHNNELREKHNCTITSVMNERQVSILMDWLYDVKTKFKLLSETFQLAAYLVGYCLSDPEFSDISPDTLQLLGTTCMMIAGKTEEMYAPVVRDYVYITDRSYTKQELIAMEQRVLVAVQFRTNMVIPLLFLRTFSRLAESDTRQHTLSKYFVDYSLCDYTFGCKYLPSEIAAGAVFLARQHLSPGAQWSAELERHSRVDKKSARKIARAMYDTIERLISLNRKSVERFYGTEKMLEVSMIQLTRP